MNMKKSVNEMSGLVAKAVKERIGTTDLRILDLVTREVTAALEAEEAALGKRRTGEHLPCSKVKTGLGAVLAAPGHQTPELSFCGSCVEQTRRNADNRAVVTTSGKNTKGVVARIATRVAEAGGDIQDISQTIVSDFFTMIMVVDLSELSTSFFEFKERLLSEAKDMGIHAVVMHEKVMRSLQRV